MALDRMQTVQALQERIRAMQAVTLGTRVLPTHEAIGPLLPGGAMKAGVAYAVPGSPALALLLAAGPAAAGAWCGAVGVPELGAEAAVAAGIDLTRLVLVPDPGPQWLPVTAQLADVLPIVLVRPPERLRDTEAARLASRLRQRGSTLVALCRWPGAEATLRITGSRWRGIDAGAGCLSGRDALVLVTSSDGRERHHELRFADPLLDGRGLLDQRRQEPGRPALPTPAPAERPGAEPLGTELLSTEPLSAEPRRRAAG